MAATKFKKRPAAKSGPSTPNEVEEFLKEFEPMFDGLCWRPQEPEGLQEFLTEVNATQTAQKPHAPGFGKPPEPRILTVGEMPIDGTLMTKQLKDLGNQHSSSQGDSRLALADIARYRPDLVILNASMPHACGIQVLKELRANSSTAHLPVLIFTSASDHETQRIALEAGATDFLSNPVNPSELAVRVRNAMMVKKYHDGLRKPTDNLDVAVQMRSAELQSSRQDMIHRLARAAEFRDDNTGNHVLRVGRYASIIARGLGLDSVVVGQIEQAAQLHDIGKIGIPDSILLKRGKLEPNEIARMQKHTFIGKRVIEQPHHQDRDGARNHVKFGASVLDVPRSPVLQMATRIALTHHEWWDGRGYPMGLAGEDIPLEGRITAVADVFDALSSKRPFKPAYPREKCFQMIREERETHFDPQVVDAFLSVRKEIVETQLDLADEEVYFGH